MNLVRSQTPAVDFPSLLKAMVDDPQRELEWLDLLSQLEFVGCRKIVKAVAFDGVNFEVLQHISEEASHAFLLKSLVEKGGLKRRSWTDAPLGAMGWRYFRELDEKVSRLQEDAHAHYPAVSWAVEKRVLELYPLYLKLTKNPGVKRVLTRILAQELRHGTQFGEHPFPEWFREKAMALEAELWQRFCHELRGWLDQSLEFQMPQVIPSKHGAGSNLVH